MNFENLKLFENKKFSHLGLNFLIVGASKPTWAMQQVGNAIVFISVQIITYHIIQKDSLDCVQSP